MDFSNAYADLDGTMWFCSNGGGVFHLDGESFMHYTVKDGLSSDQVFLLYQITIITSGLEPRTV